MSPTVSAPREGLSAQAARAQAAAAVIARGRRGWRDPALYVALGGSPEAASP